MEASLLGRHPKPITRTEVPLQRQRSDRRNADHHLSDSDIDGTVVSCGHSYLPSSRGNRHVRIEEPCGSRQRRLAWHRKGGRALACRAYTIAKREYGRARLFLADSDKRLRWHRCRPRRSCGKRSGRPHEHRPRHCRSRTLSARTNGQVGQLGAGIEDVFDRSRDAAFQNRLGRPGHRAALLSGDRACASTI